MRTQVGGPSRASKALGCFLLALALFGLLASANIWWLDSLYLGLALVVLFALSIRTLLSKWSSDDRRDVTKYGPFAAYPASWRRWLMDDQSSAEDPK